MGLRAERLFQGLQTIKALQALIGTSETSEIECKQWSDKASMKGSLAKAACGLANAEGGVIIIGMDARRRSNEADEIIGFAYVPDIHEVAATARDIVANALEPGLRDVFAVEVAEYSGAPTGCVVIYIAEGDGTPQRVSHGGQFYVRMATATLPMLYSQIADRFGRRPQARLIASTSEARIEFSGFSSSPIRFVELYVKNEGGGLGRFPAVRYLKGGGLNADAGPYNSASPRWPHSDDGNGWFSYRGSSNDVLYPGEMQLIAKLSQRGTPIGSDFPNVLRTHRPVLPHTFSAACLRTSVVCDGSPEHIQVFELTEDRFDPPGS